MRLFDSLEFTILVGTFCCFVQLIILFLLYTIATQSHSKMYKFRPYLFRMAAGDFLFSVFFSWFYRPDFLFPLPTVEITGLFKAFGPYWAKYAHIGTVLFGTIAITSVLECCLARVMLAYNHIRIMERLNGPLGFGYYSIQYVCFAVIAAYTNLQFTGSYKELKDIAIRYNYTEYLKGISPETPLVTFDCDQLGLKVCGLFIGLALFWVEFLVIFYSYLVQRKYNQARHSMSVETYRAQRNLTTVLVLQAVVPFVSFSIPLCIFGGTFLFDLKEIYQSIWMEFLFVTLLEGYPLTSACICLRYIKPYRQFVKKVLTTPRFCCRRAVTIISVPQSQAPSQISNDPVLNLYETQAELAKMKEEIKEIQKQNNELNQMTFNNLMKIVDDFQMKFSNSLEEMRQNFNNLSIKVSSYDNKFSVLNESLRKINETLSQNNENSTNRNEIVEVMETSNNNLEKETILLVGGYDGENNDSLLVLENNQQDWRLLNLKLPYDLFNHGAQFLNSNLYIFGGFSMSNNERLNWTYKLSKSLQWEKMADMNQRRDGIAKSNVILNNQIWVCGGLYDDEEDALKSVEMYDSLANTWKYMKEMNECRAGAAATVVNGKIFCVGGDNRITLKSVECYDSSSDIWTLICNTPEDIWGHDATEMHGNLIVVEGYNVWELDIINKNAVWIDKQSMSIPRGWFSIAKIIDKLFACGGEFGEKSFDDVEIFDGEVWKNGPKMTTPRRYAPTVVIPTEFARFLK